MSDRGRAALAYVGRDPLGWPWRDASDGEHVRHHALQARLAACFLLWTLGLVGVALLVTLPLSSLYPDTFLPAPSSHVSWVSVLIIGSLAGPAFLLWLVATLAGVVSGLRGSRSFVPAIGRRVGERGILRLHAASRACFIFSLAGTAGLVAYGGAITRRFDAARPGACYFLYDDRRVPRAVMAAGMIRIAHVARARWGGDSVVVDVLTPTSLGQALSSGRFLFIATHGTEGTFCMDGGVMPLASLTGRVPHHPSRLIYLAGCESDKGGAASRAFAPARTIAFARASLVTEHVWWLLATGPSAVQELE
ncbi:MAG: hypothetical protein ACAI25_20930 [Planctomycetota bacterium]